MLVYESKIWEGVWQMADNSLKGPNIFLTKSYECVVNCAISSWNCSEYAIFFSPIVILYVFIYLVSYLPDV